jgi:hypothetical protein
MLSRSLWTMHPGKKSPVKRACFIPDRARLVTGSCDGRFELQTILVGRRRCKNDQYRHRRVHLHPRSQSAGADGMDSEMLHTSEPPHQRDNNLTMPTAGCIWKISGDMLVMGTHGKKMDGQGRRRNGLCVCACPPVMRGDTVKHALTSTSSPPMTSPPYPGAQ